MKKQIQHTTPAEHGRCRIRNDILFIASLLFVVSVIGACVFFFRGEGDTVKVTVNGALYGVYPLREDIRVEIRTGEDDVNILVIEDGKAYVEYATCPDGICVSHRPISHDGESIACLPNRVAITVYSREADADMIV